MIDKKEVTNNAENLDVDSARQILQEEQQQNATQYQKGMTALAVRTGFTMVPGVKLPGGEEVVLQSFLRSVGINAEPILIVAVKQ